MGYADSANNTAGREPDPAPPAGPQQVTVVGKLLPRFPAWGDDILVRNHVSIYIINNSVVEAFPWLTGRHPTNHPAKATYNEIRGVYLPEKNAVAFNPNDGPYEGSGSFKTPYHELGHALDAHAGFSTTAGFKEAWDKSYYDFKIDYYNRVNSGARETFAESFARYFGGDKTMKTEWPKMYEYMQNLDKCMSKKGGGC